MTYYLAFLLGFFIGFIINGIFSAGSLEDEKKEFMLQCHSHYQKLLKTKNKEVPHENKRSD